MPFCVVKCGYCDFNSYVPQREEEFESYLEGLAQELALAAPPRRPASVFIGGGTPTLLDEARFARLLAILAAHVDLAAVGEVTLEANPESTTPAKAALARAAGVNRASLGAQSFHASHLQLLDRAHSAAQTEAAFAAFRAAGFTNLNLDLMFSLPGQTPAQWQQDLEHALALGPDHLSCYSLTFEPGTRFFRDLQQGRMRENDDRVDRAMFEFTRARLADAGFTAYEISNFAGRGGACRHNDHYWLQGDYVGVGPGAASHRAGVRSTNLKALPAWSDSLRRGLLPVASAETLTPRQRAAEALWLGIRRRDGVDLAAIGARLGFTMEEHFAAALRDLQQRGWLVFEGSRIRLTTEGILFANLAGETFLAA